ncbi:XdhC family protein [Rufibacter tibetensis]|uniref:Alanine dehydrogenase n=1 Tax=Rufibacter tibetensis TaxID=512763 RepID=A0A0N7HWY3_9BACT|nr:XdhC/CoxI family protein [Rufibacter tibetensis]ALJ00529.1 alanine dehydrogenase [Rufibacter tibetensis]
MKEIQEIVAAYQQHQNKGLKTALATVVHVEGSSYRRPGARMLVAEDGTLTGAISGGCLEGDALRKARMAMVQGEPSLVKYDTMDDDDSKLGVGLGCNGIIHILIEPIDSTDPYNPLVLLQHIVSQRRSAVVVTLFSMQERRGPQPGTLLLLTEDGLRMGAVQTTALEEQIIQHAQEALLNEAFSFRRYISAQELTGFIEFLPPTLSLVICGAGNDVMPLVNMAALLGWHTAVVDGRANYATAERFPLANKVLVSKPDQVLENVQVDQRTAFLLVTHNYNYDLAMLRNVLPLQLKYIGVLGPKTKLNRIILELEEEGSSLSEMQLQSIYGPTGLDIGAETSEEIALSILAEIKAVFSNRTGGYLRERKESIHADSAFDQPEAFLK